MKHKLDLIGLNGDTIWLESNFTAESIDNYTALIILRDPIQRWLSICPGNERMSDPEFIKDLENIKNFKDWHWDEHSAPQSDFLTGINLSNAVFFYCDSNLSSNVKHFLDTQGVKTVNPEPVPQNESSNNPFLKTARQVWKNIFVNNPSVLNNLKESYQNDYDLIQKVRFYQNA